MKMESAVDSSSSSVTVIGIGYLGLTHAVSMAEIGHDVLAFDIDAGKIAKAESGESPWNVSVLGRS